MKKYTEILTQTERIEMIKSGAVAQLTSTNSIDKYAQLGERVNNAFKGTLLTAALLGVPVGVAWHFLDRATNARRRSEREQQEKLKFYRNIAGNIETNMAEQQDPEKVIG